MDEMIMLKPISIPNDKLIESVKRNRHYLYVLSIDQLLETHRQKKPDAYLNDLKTVAGYTSTALDIYILNQLLNDIGITGKAYQKRVNGKNYVIFKGHPGLRHIFTAPRYLAKNPKVVDMAIGQAGIKNSIRSGARLTIFLTVPIVILQHILRDEIILSDLISELAVSMMKISISSIIAAIAATGVGTVTTIAAAPLAVAIFVGLLTAWSLDKIDGDLAITKRLAQVLREIESETVGEFNHSWWVLEKTLRKQIMNNITPGSGIFYP